MEPEQHDVSDPLYAKSLFESLVRGTKLSNQVPAAEQHDYNSTFPAYNEAMR